MFAIHFSLLDRIKHQFHYPIYLLMMFTNEFSGDGNCLVKTGNFWALFSGHYATKAIADLLFCPGFKEQKLTGIKPFGYLPALSNL
jgi:hypothetical protein